MTEHARHDLLASYGRYYGEQRFAIAFTASTEGDDAKRVTSRGWDKTAPLADGDYGASYVAGRGATKNPAIVLRPSNLIVLECDTEQDLVRIESLNLPQTVTVRSSKPYKRHFWFRPPAELESLPYVAFRFESGKLTADSGRYFLAPPALHPSGVQYAFLPDRGPTDVPIATLPLALYQALTDQAQVEDDEQRQAIELDPTAKFREGSRRAALFRYACMLRRWGLDHQEILQATLRYNTLKCDPPVDRIYVEVQVDGAMKKRGGQELAEPRLAAGYIELPEEPPHDSWTPIDLNTIADEDPVRPDLAPSGLVYPGKRHVFSGPPESAKTLAAYIIGIEVAREGGHIVLIDFEMGRRDALRRLRELGATPGEISRFLYLEPEEPADEQKIDRLAQLDPQLVIVDAAAGAYDLQGLDDNKRQDVERLSRVYIRTFWRRGIATIVIDHVVKNTETRGRFVIGSERKLGGSDVHLGFDPITPINRGTAGLYKLTTHKDRGGFLRRGNLGELALVSDPDTHKISWEWKPAVARDAWLPTHLMEKLSVELATADEALSRNKLERSIDGGNMQQRRLAIDKLVEYGYAEETKGQNKSRLYTHIKLFSESEWNARNHPGSSGSSTFVPGSSVEPNAGSSSSSPPYRGTDDATPNQTTPGSSNDEETQYLIDKYVDYRPDELTAPADDNIPL